jgi:hypothetical protein
VPDPLWIDAASGSPAYSGQEMRLAGIVPAFAGAGTSLGVRTGVRLSGSGTDLLVTAQATPNMTVKVNTGTVVVQGSTSASQGAYLWALDTVTNVTIATAHATLSRTDLIVVRIRDSSIDTSSGRDATVTVVTGTAGAGVPALPVDATYLEIARVTVAAAATTITSSAISDKRPFTAALGGIIPCKSSTLPAAGTVPAHQVICRTDLGNTFWASPDGGTTWRMTAPYRATNTLTGAVSSVAFTGLPTGMNRLLLTLNVRSTATGFVVGGLALRFNSDVATNYFYFDQFTYGVTPTVGTTNTASQTSGHCGVIPCGDAAASHWGQVIIEISGASSGQAVYWTYRSIAYPSAADSYLDTGGGVWNVGAAVTAITLLPGAGSFATGSTFKLEAWD